MILALNVVEKEEDMPLYGVSGTMQNGFIPKYATHMTKKYFDIVHKKCGQVLPFIIMTHREDADYDLFAGSTASFDGLEKSIIPKGSYVVLTIKPKLGFFWEPSVMEAKKYFHRVWVRRAPEFEFAQIEFEYQDERILSRQPVMDIYFGIRPAAKEFK